MRRATVAAATLASVVLLLTAGCSSDTTQDLQVGAACTASTGLDEALTGFAAALEPGATASTLDLAHTPVNAAIEVLHPTIPSAQEDLSQSVDQADQALEAALDSLPDDGQYDQAQVDSVQDELTAMVQANANLAAGLGC